MQEDYIPHYEVYHNRRWSLIEAERVPERTIVLLLVFSHREVLHIGLSTIRKKVEKFSKIQQSLGDRILLRASLTSYNKNVAVVFESAHKPKTADCFVPLSQCAPISSLSDYLDTVLNIIHIVFAIHRNNLLHNCVNINGFVSHVSDINNVQLVDIGDMMDLNSISTGQGKAAAEGEKMSKSAKSENSSTTLTSTSAGQEDTNSVGSSEGSSAMDGKKLNKEYLEELVDYRYASPEQTGRIEGVIDRRSDVYSLGVLMYELAVGTVPFNSTDVLEVLHSHMTQPPPDLPSTLWNRTDVLTRMSMIIQKMMINLFLGLYFKYQSLYGVIRDLEYLRSAVATQTDVSSFVIGTHDLEDEFILGLKGSMMYGRESHKHQIAQFIADFEVGHQAGLIAIKGHSGTGKSTFVQYIFEQLHHKRDSGVILLSGKHDRLKQSPYGVLVELTSDLVRRLLALPAEELAVWSTNLNEALAPNGQVLIDFIPEMEGVIGPQPSVPTLTSTESRQRFESVFITFCEVFFASYTVIWFFDDVQWADTATIALMESVNLNNSMKNFLNIVAFRDTDVTDGHPVKVALNNIMSKGTHSLMLELGDLELCDVEWIVQDCFRCKDREKVSLLANLIFKKTRGNPLFICQLLRSITSDNYVYFNYKNNEWEWSIEKLSTVPYPEIINK